MCTYLTKRGSTYYFRRVIPAELRPALGGKAEFMLSLRTKDREQAKRLIPDKTKETDRLLDEAGRRGAPIEISRPTGGPPISEFQIEQGEWAAQDEAERQARWEAREPLRRRLLAAFERSTMEISREEAAMRDLLRDVQFELTVEQERRLARRVERAEDRRGIRAPERAEDASLVPENATQGIMLDAKIIDLWAAERKPASKTIQMHRSDARWLLDRIGRKPVDQITRGDILAFKAKLIEEGQTATNIKNKLSRVRTLLQYAADNGHAAANVAAGVSIKDPDAGKKKRLPLSLAALNAIFASPVFAHGERPAQGRGEAAYWMPLLAIFTGARLEELGQLRPDDVSEQSYPDPEGQTQIAWFIRITAEAGKLKNVASERLVPVHPELERLGFLDYAKAMQKQRVERLFPALTKGPHGNFTHRWGQWFGVYLRKDCGVTDRRMTFHSFRHAFIDYARRPDIPEAVQRRLVGHGGQDVHDDYGEGYGLHWLVEGVKLYKVPGLCLPPA
ncbi:DUF6538 domain-containing protein [Sphingomonas sp. DT-207]|uniref:DUF6538 domain-containing protein n=1 Tax=Sphingomonas sp. DT-207 TaxID=3396167 RepID=UPI003F19B6B4